MRYDGASHNLAFRSVDAFGKSVAISKVKAATLVQLSTGDEKNVVDKIQIQDNGAAILIVLDSAMDLDWASYSLKTVLTTSFKSNVYNTVKFTIKTKIFPKTVVMLSQTAD